MATYYVATDGNDTTGDGAIGTPYATPGKAAAVATTAGDIIYVKAGTYTLSTSTPGAGGPVVLTSGAKVLMEGYSVTPGDKAARPVLSAGVFGSITLFTLSGSSSTNPHRLVCCEADANGQATVVGFSLSSERHSLRLCKAVGCATGFLTASTLRATCRHCVAATCTTGFLYANGVGCTALSCGTGYTVNDSTLSHCLAYDCTGDGFSGARGQITHCTSRDNGGDGFDLIQASECSFCVAENNANYGFRGDNSVSVLNSYARNNTSGESTGIAISEITALTQDTATNAATDDFSPNDTAGGGAVIRGVDAYPKALANNLDAGAMQSAGSGGYTYGDDDAAEVLTTADGAGSYVPPVTADVLAPADGGTAFGPSSGIDGTLTLPELDEVDGGVTFGPAGSLEGTGVNATTILTALGLATGNLDTQLGAIKTVVDDVPNNTEFEARSIPSADYFVVTDYTAPDSAATIAAAVEAAILDEGDATALLAAIGAKVEEFLINDGDATATLAAIAAAVKAAMETGTVQTVTGNVNGSVASVTNAVTTDEASRTASQADVSGLAMETTAQAILEDTGTTLPAAIAAIDAGSGSGTYACTWTVTDGTDPLQSATISFWLNGILKGTGTTDADGEVSMSLDAATYTVAVTADGHVFAGTTHAVSATAGTWAKTFAMTAVSFTPSTLPDTVTVRWTAIDSADYQAVGASEATIYMRIKTPPTTDGFAWDKGERSATSDANGVIQFTDVPLGCVVRVRLGATGEWNDVEIPSDATSPYDAGEFVGVV